MKKEKKKGNTDTERHTLRHQKTWILRGVRLKNALPSLEARNGEARAEVCFAATSALQQDTDATQQQNEREIATK